MKLSNSTYCRATWLLVLGLVVVAQLSAPAGSAVEPLRLILPSFFYPAAWSVTIFLAIALSPRDRLVLSAAVAACLAAGALLGLALEGSLHAMIRNGVIGAGLAPYLFALARIAGASGAERSGWIDMMAMATLIHLSAIGTPAFRDQTGDWLPRIFDLRIAQWDEAFGAQPSAVMAQAFAAAPFLHRLSFAAYTFVQIPIVVLAAFDWRRRREGEYSVLPAFIIGSVIGFLCYCVTPAIGPKAYFGADFPLWSASDVYLSGRPLFDFDPHHARNAMPSMHIAWAIFILLFTRGFPLWARACAGVYALLIACATLGLGEHYLMDLIVALPVVLLTRALCAGELGWASGERRRAIGSGLAMLAFWLAMIRIGPPLAAPSVLALAAITIILSVVLEAALAGAPRAFEAEMAQTPLPAPV